MGKTYYLHQGRTKTGKPRYFAARTVREGALTAMPEGYELTESINGVVSVRRVTAAVPKIPDADLALARAELARHPHLRRHRIEEVKGEIVVHEPLGSMSLDAMGEMARALGLSPAQMEARLGASSAQTRYDPVMKFVPAEPGQYAVHRMTYRGDGGWSWPLAFGPLKKLVKKYLKHVGTEEFFELL
jgi:hypothetical protein